MTLEPQVQSVEDDQYVIETTEKKSTHATI